MTMEKEQALREAFNAQTKDHTATPWCSARVTPREWVISGRDSQIARLRLHGPNAEANIRLLGGAGAVPHDCSNPRCSGYLLWLKLKAFDELVRVATACEQALTHWTNPQRSSATFSMDVYNAKQLVRILRPAIPKAEPLTPNGETEP